MNRLRPVDTAIIEACDITPDGKVYLTTAIGISPILLEKASKIIIELNSFHSPRLREIIDVVVLHGTNSWPKGLDTPMSRVGKPYAQVDPSKVIGVVKNNEPDEVAEFSDSDETCVKIAQNVEKFLLDEMIKGSIPKTFLPTQSGVGNIGNAVMKQLGESKEIPPFYMYTDVLQDSLIPIMHCGKLLGAITCALTVTTKSLNEVYSNMDYFAKRIVLRPHRKYQIISSHHPNSE